jgi:hypothetical protein
MSERCMVCGGCRWVCENHPDRPWEGERACDCGGAGMPCPACNSSEVTVPEMPDDFVEDVSIDRRIPRGTFIDPVGFPPGSEAGHFIRCEACGGWIDCRDLGSVSDHQGPLPHPVTDKPQ